MPDYLIRDALVVNEGDEFYASVYIRKGHIEFIGGQIPKIKSDFIEIDANGKWLFPGVIDVHVHFREPGLTHKADIFSESHAAVAGGVTSFIDMPNTQPKTLSIPLLKQKFSLASVSSRANYSFYLGASNDNLEEMKKAKENGAPGIKVFLGASTGNMLVDNESMIEKIFTEVPGIITVHAENEDIIQKNLKSYKQKYSSAIPFSAHADIRSAQACFEASQYAIRLALKYGTRLHLAHVSTLDELQLLDHQTDVAKKAITSETTVHHLLYDTSDYELFQGKIKCNPSIKGKEHKTALLKGLKDGVLDMIATDHAPHTLDEKMLPYPDCPSGIPFIQFSLPGLLEFYRKGIFTLPEIVRFTSHHPALAFKIKDRGFIREGYWADLVLVSPDKTTEVNKENILSKCGWSPLEGQVLQSSVFATFVSGNLSFLNLANVPFFNGKQLEFND
ncbi:MAG TPA: dihydroorotase [Bacteroidia bacterium]|nr:dihydroorotase [Bacteroidia bacterium]HRS59058.1 dihydroorotase [Bacteroidia bacterium]